MQIRQGLPGEGANAANLENLRAEGGNLLAAADEAIRAALSGNSLDFLNSVRQTGGE
ncbi:MAG: hypothetical protein WBL61_02700 [Bryobacteraceae bacterium]